MKIREPIKAFVEDRVNKASLISITNFHEAGLEMYYCVWRIKKAVACLYFSSGFWGATRPFFMLINKQNGVLR
jgi:hypothetical protein